MCADWFNKNNKKNAIDPQIVLNEIAKVASVDAAGNIVFALRGLPDNLDTILESAVMFDEDIPSCAYADIVRKAMHQAIKADRLECGFVRTALQTGENHYRAMPSHDYVLVSAISFALPYPFTDLKVDGYKLSLRNKLPKKYDRSAIERTVASVFPMPLPNNYANMLVRIRARTEKEAAQAALAGLGVHVGLWNYILTRGRVSLFFNGGRPAIGSLMAGPVHTLHRSNGQLVENMFWYEPSYVAPPSLLSLTPDEAIKFQASERWIRKKLQDLPTRKRLHHAFQLYGEALNETSMDVAFLKLWTVLELLTDTTQDPAEKTIKRVSFIFKDAEFTLQELRHIRDRRNRLVHLNESSENRQTHIYQLKPYVDHMFNHLLDPMNKKRTMEQIGEFLDQSTDLQRNQKQIKLLTDVNKFRTP